MYKSLISRNNDVIFYAALWIMWSLSWILILSMSYSMNPDYSLFDLFTGEMNNNEKFIWITVIFLITFVVSMFSLIMLIVKTIALQKNTKIYNLNDGGLIFVYFITTFLFYIGIVFFILYKDRLANVRTTTNMYESKKLESYIGDRSKSVQLTDAKVVNVYNNTSKRPDGNSGLSRGRL